MSARNEYSNIADSAISLTQQLLRYPSITPNDAGSFDFLVGQLQQIGFQCHEINKQGVRNLVALRRFGAGGTLAFAGHLDVVPAGPSGLWLCPPFSGQIIGERLYGRGVADMKGGIACFVAAIKSQVQSLDKGALMLLITCDEEGEAEFGTAKLMEYLHNEHPELLPEYCLVGEPTCKDVLGDTIKIGRRGSLSGHVHVYGQQGHVAYPAQCNNAAHNAIQLTHRLVSLEWDVGSKHMPGTTFQVTKLNSGEFVDNVVPGNCHFAFNIRYSSKFTEHSLKELVSKELEVTGLQFDLSWQRPCEMYFNRADNFVSVLSNAIAEHQGVIPNLSTDGGTSDGRFIASEKTQVIEFGLKNDSIHQVNESADLADIAGLAKIFESVISSFCCAAYKRGLGSRSALSHVT